MKEVKCKKIEVTLLKYPTPLTERKPGLLNLLKCKCPRCRRGYMFKNSNPYILKETMKMNEQCSVCGQPFSIEVGFYYGSSFISYTLSVFLSGLTFVSWWLIIGFSLNDNRVFYWIFVNAIFLILLQPYLMRVSRTLWLSLFVLYDDNWREKPAKIPERTNKDQENNW